MASVDDLCDALNTCSLEEVNFPNLSDEGRILLQCLKKLHCPFTWNTPGEELWSNIDRMEEKIGEIDEDENLGIPWRKLILNLALSYEYCIKGSLDLAHSKQEELEEMFASALENDEEDKWCIALKGLEHVILSTKCFHLLKENKYTDAEETFKKITLLDALNKNDQASVWGTRAALFMEYGYAGTKQSLTYIEKAIALDQMQGEWLFLRGKALGRIRRIDDFCGVPTDLEVNSLEKSFELTNNVSHMVFLAQALRETSSRIFSKHKNDFAKFKTKCENLNDRSYNMYKKALDLRGNCTHINIRCAMGFFLLPYPFQNMDLALECINKALELAPQNSMAYHWAGKYYEKVKDYEKAAFYLEKADEMKVYGATMDLLKLKWRLESKYDPADPDAIPEYDPLPLLEKSLQVYGMKYRLHETLCQIGSYWYFVRGNFKEALKSWKEVFNEDRLSSKLQSHKTVFIPMSNPVNICDIMLNEAMLILQDESTPPEERELMEALVNDLSKGYALTSPISWREKILGEIVQRNQNPSPYQNKGHGNFQGREAGSERGRGHSGQERNHGNDSGRGRYSSQYGMGQEQLHGREQGIMWRNVPQSDMKRDDRGQDRFSWNSGQNWRNESSNRQTAHSRGGENNFMHGNYGRGGFHSTSFRVREQRLRGNWRNSSSPED